MPMRCIHADAAVRKTNQMADMKTIGIFPKEPKDTQNQNERNQGRARYQVEEAVVSIFFLATIILFKAPNQRAKDSSSGAQRR